LFRSAQVPASSPDSGAQSSEAESACAPDSGAQETRCAPDSGAPPQHYVVEEEGQRPRDPFAICQPLIKALTEAGITVSWGMPPEDRSEERRVGKGCRARCWRYK